MKCIFVILIFLLFLIPDKAQASLTIYTCEIPAELGKGARLSSHLWERGNAIKPFISIVTIRFILFNVLNLERSFGFQIKIMCITLELRVWQQNGITFSSKCNYETFYTPRSLKSSHIPFYMKCRSIRKYCIFVVLWTKKTSQCGFTSFLGFSLELRRDTVLQAWFLTVGGAWS